MLWKRTSTKECCRTHRETSDNTEGDKQWIQ
jgi:hypothetical protein